LTPNQQASEIIYSAISPFSESGSKVDIAYVEFHIGGVIEPPEESPLITQSYFSSLAMVADRDYLAVPITSQKVVTNSSGGKSLEILIVISEGEGVNGHPFSASNASCVYGVTLASQESNGRPAKLFATHYFPQTEQTALPASSNLAIRLQLVCNI